MEREKRRRRLMIYRRGSGWNQNDNHTLGVTRKGRMAGKQRKVIWGSCSSQVF